jgi:hypothetical protein
MCAGDQGNRVIFSRSVGRAGTWTAPSTGDRRRVDVKGHRAVSSRDGGFEAADEAGDGWARPGARNQLMCCCGLGALGGALQLPA